VKIEGTLLETVAQAVHSEYLREQLADGAALGDSPGLAPWDALDEDLRMANRAQALAMREKLESIGCGIAEGPDEPPFAFTEAELDRLARVEHDRWCQQRTDAGWTYGPVQDHARRTHPSLVAWAQLSEVERDKDRDAVRNIPAALRVAGLRVVREPAS